MKNVQHILIALLFMAFALPHPGTSQESSTIEPIFEVNRVYLPFSIPKADLSNTNTIHDLKRYFEPSWIREIISVEVLASIKGKKKNVISKNDTFTQEQKAIMDMADLGTGISFNIRYTPLNTLKNNEVKEINFSIVVEPESNATFPGGEEQLKKYLKKTAIDKIPEGSFEKYDLAAIFFTINEEGKITNTHVFEDSYQTYKNKEIEELLLESICNMPRWKPAAYPNGSKVKQGFFLTVGNHGSCLIPLLNMHHWK